MTPDMFAMNDGTILVNVHTAQQCSPEHCCLHNPSNHHMLLWPGRWDGVFKQMWRQCEHGLEHPDPDDLAFLRIRWGAAEAAVGFLHQCDGCCQPNLVPAKQIEGGDSGRAPGAAA